MNWRWDVVQMAWPVVFEGAKLTLVISALGILFGSIIGFLVGLIRSRRPDSLPLRLLFWLAGGYVELVRGTPFLVQLYLVNYGPYLLLGTNIPELTAGVIAISLNSGAYVAEIARGAIQSIDKGQMEAGRSLGLTYGQTMRHIILPQALRRALPPLANEFVTLIKESSVVSVLGIQETTFKGRMVGTTTFAPFEPMLVVTVYYLIMTGVTSQLVRLLERRMGRSDSH
ncbi:His/Glu/Gln/Arg/opine family amino acid ABC transporter permease subunit [Symbiobacterium terraclitae]|uniref:His/Glu/Gln/Arg/opine family amino acid ABC transporter permease subunit n=1 Tax=Symbiobacterium terraclitae TaxID=557451 RepID=A0ABS4JVJ1_9FIRM|nr:amino acid ABC transporter permease [Symbiobacterium terraclitae]MBP2019574.1 His/Glu/Gln/Arg/opine family amino acid ABC transporter permease subunit [Symbiobacterium terraclitae]